MEPKKRHKVVPRSLYIKILRDIRRQADELGIKFNVYWRPIKWTESPKRGAYGTYCTRTKVATVTTRGRAGRASMLFTAFHELRHAQHHAFGFYKSYYRDDGCPGTDFVEGFAAEQNCNDYAYEELSKLGIDYTPQKYSEWTVYVTNEARTRYYTEKEKG